MKILLVVYDNESYIHWFPQGIAYIASVLRKDHEVFIYSQDLHHYPEEHLTDYLNNNKFDVIGIGVIGGYYQYRKLLLISEAINKSKNKPFYIIGGHGPSPDPKYFLEKTKADAIIIGEGEETIVDLLNNINSFENVDGIAFMDNKGEVKINKRRSLIKDIDSIPFPAYDLFPIEYYRLMREPHATSSDFLMPVLSGRGCTFKCNFCYRMDKGFRPRSSESIIDEIKFLKEKYNINYIVFSDELLMSSEKRVIDLSEKIIKSNLNIKWNCNGRLNYATPEVIKIMKKSGCVFINYGIECFDDDILTIMNKKLTTDQIVKGIENTISGGISPGFNIIFGNISEDENTLNKGVDFLLKYDDHSQLRTIRPVTPYPGSSLYYKALKDGLLKDCADFYENKHINSDLLCVNFTKLSDDEYYDCLHEANRKLLIKNYETKYKSILNQLDDLYINKNKNFRGFRQT